MKEPMFTAVKLVICITHPLSYHWRICSIVEPDVELYWQSGITNHAQLVSNAFDRIETSLLILRMV